MSIKRVMLRDGITFSDVGYVGVKEENDHEATLAMAEVCWPNG